MTSLQSPGDSQLTGEIGIDAIGPGCTAQLSLGWVAALEQERQSTRRLNRRSPEEVVVWSE